MRTDARKDKSWVETREQVAALNAVQSELVALPRAIDGPMHWLVVLGVCAVESLHTTINSTMHKLLDDKHNRIDAPRDTLNLHLWHNPQQLLNLLQYSLILHVNITMD